MLRSLGRLLPLLVLILATAHGGAARADVADAADAIKAGDCKAAGEAINRGLERSDAQALFFAGFLYDATGCVEADLPRAARYYRRAADLGNTEAADALGLAYGLGRGVERDYAEAYRWFGVARGPGGRSPADGVDARLAGYAATVAHLALGKVRYPVDMERAGIESAFDVLFVPATGEVSVRGVRTAIEVGSNVPRSRVFTDLVRDAYRDAAAQLQRPGDASGSDAFATPWRFAMRRNKSDERLYGQGAGAITIGDTTAVARER